jgi:hypothetical protein
MEGGSNFIHRLQLFLGEVTTKAEAGSTFEMKSVQLKCKK